MRAIILVPLLALALPAVAAAQNEPIVIRLANDTEAERQTRDQLQRLLREHDVERWIETREILIDANSLPHSHPVLTLHTRHLGEDMNLLATFVHEQFHWYAIRHGQARDRAMAAFRERYPEVPDREAGGARDDDSTYLHLVVCDLEFQAMTLLVGGETARRVLAGTTHYQWIYRHVLEDPFVRSVMTDNGLILR